MSWQYQVVHLGAEQQDVIRGTRRMTHLTALHATQTFFATRAAGWEDRFAHDGPQCYFRTWRMIITWAQIFRKDTRRRKPPAN